MHSGLIRWMTLSALAAAIGAGYSIVAGGSPEIGASVGFAIGGSLIGLELFVIQRPVGEPLRQLPLPLYILATAAIWAVIIGIFVESIPALIEYDEPDDVFDDDPTSLTQDMVFSFSVALLLNVTIRVSALIGPRVLLNFLLGRYYRPLREERVFMFLDIADSTRLAEELGDIEVQNLIRRFFFDIARPIDANGGETHRYIGDEIVVTWPLENRRGSAPWLTCALDIRSTIKRRSAWYQARFGVVPRFRIGMHGGGVVASEVGEAKREIVYFGDTVNTAARLCAACSEVGADWLVSAELLARSAESVSVTAQRLEPLTLKGKDQPFQVFALGEPSVLSRK